MSHLKPLLKCFAIILTGLILTQCGEKTSAQYVQEGIEYSKQGRYHSAGESFLKAVEKDPKNIDGHYGLGGIYNLEKKYGDAEKAFKSAIQLDPTHYNAWYSLGYTYELMGDSGCQALAMLKGYEKYRKAEDSECQALVMFLAEAAEKSYEKYRRLKGKMDSIMNKEKP